MTEPTRKGIYLTGLAGVDLNTLSFLTFHMSTNLYDPSAKGHSSYCGAVPDLADKNEKTRKWSKIDPKWVEANKAKFTHHVLWDFEGGPTHMAYLDVFADGAFAALAKFTHEKRLDFCSGSNSVANGPAIVRKALKGGFERLGMKYDKPSLLQKIFSNDAVVGDVKAFVDDALKGSFKLDGNVYGDFEEVNISEKDGPWGPKPKDTAFKWPGAPGGYMNGAEEFWAKFWLPVNPKEAPKPNQDTEGCKAIAARQTSKMIDPAKGMVWANIFGFRGDSRLPILVKAAGGMFANATRDDRQEAVKERVAAGNAPLDHVSHQLAGKHNTDSSGYVSVSSSRYATQEFIRRDLKNNGFVYLVRVRAGVCVNKTWTQPPSPQECEVSVPGAIPWEDVVGWRQVKDGAFAGPLFLTKDKEALPSAAKDELKKVMAYKSR